MTSKNEIKEKELILFDLVGSFCVKNLDDDYRNLCEKLVLKLGRKRDVPFKRGKLEIWAAAIVYAIGSINFLFDNSFEPHMTAKQISDYFGTKNSTVTNKAKQIKDMFKLSHFSPEFSTKRMEKDNIFNDLVMIDGLIVPIDDLPIDLQEMVKEARSKGENIEFRTE